MFPHLPVLENLKKKVSSLPTDLKDISIISVQHLLETTGSLFETLICLGVQPENIYLLGKIYSTNQETQLKLRQLGIFSPDSTIPRVPGLYKESLIKDIKNLWLKIQKDKKQNSKIIILDDGGYCLHNIPDEIKKQYQIIGIEQTTSGMRNGLNKLPLIDVAASAAKIFIEPSIVSEAIYIKLGSILEQTTSRNIGLVGFGNIGRALSKDLLKINFNIYVFDKDNSKKKPLHNVHFCNSADEVFYASDTIIGVTGEDISNEDWIINSNGNKTLISCSSGDIEFCKLLKISKNYIQESANDPLQNLKLLTPNGHIINIIRGGFVANFDGDKNSSPPMTIQITRGLLLSAVIQSAFLLKNNKARSGIIMLDPKLQRFVVQEWFKNQPKQRSNYSKEIINGFSDIEWIKKHSSGDFIDLSIFSH